MGNGRRQLAASWLAPPAGAGQTRRAARGAAVQNIRTSDSEHHILAQLPVLWHWPPSAFVHLFRSATRRNSTPAPQHPSSTNPARACSCAPCHIYHPAAPSPQRLPSANAVRLYGPRRLQSAPTAARNFFAGLALHVLVRTATTYSRTRVVIERGAHHEEFLRTAESSAAGDRRGQIPARPTPNTDAAPAPCALLRPAAA
jgi:hypothetical protein